MVSALLLTARFAAAAPRYDFRPGTFIPTNPIGLIFERAHVAHTAGLIQCRRRRCSPISTSELRYP